MAKSSPKNNGNGDVPESIHHSTVPQGYEETPDRAGVIGFWNPDLGPIHCVPLDAAAIDSQIEKKKSSILIRAKLIADCKIMPASRDDDDDDSDEPIEGARGDIIGIWYKPGMSKIANYRGLKCYMFEEGEKDVGKPNAMKLYRIFHSPMERDQPLYITQDYRKDSKSTSLPFKKIPDDYQAEVSEDDIPF